MNVVNTTVRLIVLTFVFIGGAITMAGPDIVNGNNAPATEKPAVVTTPNKAKLTISTKTSALSIKKSRQTDSETTS